ncbi:LysR substrate-binding domain-containing protein [Pseudomonas aestuarii]|uniref:LysR substrate-binding domain-containing protein n=1 Tax=Pseudomonas aestuarii TaxID=3018340 RepID=UPI002FDFCE46
MAVGYLARKPSISRPEVLVGQDWLALSDLHSDVLNLQGPGDEVQKLRIESRVSCNNILAVRHFTLAGMGISLQPEQEIREELALGSLCQLLPDWRLPLFGIYLVTPRRDAQPAKVRYAIEALRQHLLLA